MEHFDVVIVGGGPAGSTCAWRLCLAGSQAAFTTGWMQLFQVTFARGGSRDLQWTRGSCNESSRHAQD